MAYDLPAGIINNASVYFYANASMVFGTGIMMEPSDAVFVLLDYSQLAPPTTINSFTFSTDVSTNPPLVLSYPVIDTTGRVLTFLLTGGIFGQQYNITVATVTSMGARNDILTVSMPPYDSCGCGTSMVIPGISSKLPPGNPFVNSYPRYFWGTLPPNAPNVLDQWYNTSTGELFEWATDGIVYFWEKLVPNDLVLEAPLDNIRYARMNGGWNPDIIQADVPNDTRAYSRSNGAWVANMIANDAPGDGNIYGRFNNSWALVPITNVIPTDAPTNGFLYGRMNNNWVQVPAPVILVDAPIDNVYLRTEGSWESGGTLTGSLNILGDITTEGALTIGTDLTVAGATAFGAQVGLAYDPISPLQAATKQYVDNRITSSMPNAPYLPLSGGTLTGQLTLYSDPGNPLQAATKQYVDDRTPITVDAPNDGQYYSRQNNNWAVGPGGMTDAPNDAFQYFRGQMDWNSGGVLSGDLTINGITTLSANPTSPLQAVTKQYVDSNHPNPSSSTPLMNGIAAVGVSVTYARADHVHPTDTSLYPASNPAGYITLAQATVASPVQSVAGRVGAVVLTNADITNWNASLLPYALLVSPVFTGVPLAPTAAPNTNTTQLATTAFTTNAVNALANAVTNALGSYLQIMGGTMTGFLTLNSNPVSALQAATKQYVDTPTNMSLDMGTY